MKIGLFGGTFNPIHNSHLYLVQKCYQKLNLNQIIIMPTFVPPHKSSTDLASAQSRFEMCQIACRPFPFLEVSDYEIQHQGVSYTYQTLKYLTGKYPKDEIFLLMGSDMFLSLPTWKHPEMIYQMSTICGIARQEGEILLLEQQLQRFQQMNVASQILYIDPQPISSTQIRNWIRRGESVEHYLPVGVWDYILEHKLYGAGA